MTAFFVLYKKKLFYKLLINRTLAPILYSRISYFVECAIILNTFALY